MNDVKEFCKKIKPIKLSVTKNLLELEYKSKIIFQTKFLDDYYSNPPLSLRYFCILNDITTIPICDCGNPVLYKKFNPIQGFYSFCSKSCSNNKKYKQCLKDHDWLYNERINLKKSKEQIAKELNCSITPVNKWLKIHDIPDIKYNQSNSLALLYLKNYDWLYNNHVVNHRTCEDIGNELGVSKSTVSIALYNLNIKSNDPNSYDKKQKPSKECLEVVNFIKSFYTKTIEIDKKGIIGSLELDIYLPEDNLAIEYNGCYSHIYRPEEKNFSTRKDKNYHVTKTIECEKNNIQLIHIFSNQWKMNKNIWKSFIKNKLGYTDNKIYARNCIIKNVSVNDKNNFLINNHIQGNAKSKIRLGLYHENELLSLITFDKSRYNKKYQWELVRFCTKLNYNVIGGFSKLLKYFRNNYSGSIISYANRTYSNGNLYEKNGFILLKINKPSYWYVKKNSEILLHKTNFKKKNLLKELYEPTWTEFMLSKELGYNIIWDCGTKSYILE